MSDTRNIKDIGQVLVGPVVRSPPNPVFFWGGGIAHPTSLVMLRVVLLCCVHGCVHRGWFCCSWTDVAYVFDWPCWFL